MTDVISPPAISAAGSPSAPPYDPRLTNDDLAPLKDQRWGGSYNIFAFWMSDVHSVGGYVTAGSLFALGGLASWQVLVSLLAGITIVYFFCNLVAKPSQVTGVPYPVICRSVFGVLGANIPAIIRGLIAVAWYGIQTFLRRRRWMWCSSSCFRRWRRMPSWRTTVSPVCPRSAGSAS